MKQDENGNMKELAVSIGELKKLRDLIEAVTPEYSDKIDEAFAVFVAYKTGELSAFPKYIVSKNGFSGFFVIPIKDNN